MWKQTEVLAIASVTKLLGDLVGIVTEYLFAQEHRWSTNLGGNIERLKFTHHCCLPTNPSLEFQSCICFPTYFQHVCSLHTVNNGPNCWQIKLSACERWWLGLVSSSKASAFPNLYYSDDSLSEENDVLAVGPLAVGPSGTVSFNGHELSTEYWQGFSNQTVVAVHCDLVRNFVFFSINDQTFSVGPLPFDLALARPFVQLATGAAKGTATLVSSNSCPSCPITHTSSYIKHVPIRKMFKT